MIQTIKTWCDEYGMALLIALAAALLAVSMAHAGLAKCLFIQCIGVVPIP